MAVFNFSHPNPTAVAIPDNTFWVDQSIYVFVSGTITDVNVTVDNLTHTFSADLDMALFGPDLSKNLMLMSDVGGSENMVLTTLAFDDSAASGLPVTSGGGPIAS